MSMRSVVRRLAGYLLLLGAVVLAGTASGLIVMQIALRGERLEISVPSVEGNEVVNALEKITRAGLNLKVTSLEYDDEKPRNTIIRQAPNAGSLIRQGRDVHVVISRGPREFDMPDLRDLSVRQATNLLQEKGISVAEMARVHSDVDEGRVVAQYPPAGIHVSDMGQAELLVSLGREPRMTGTPSFLGLSTAQVKKEIIKAGFAPGKVVYETRPDAASDTVVAQNPPAGMPSPEGTEMDITVAQAAPSAGRPATYALYRFTLPANAGPSEVKVVREGKDGKKREIYNGSNKGGETISLMVDLDGGATVRVFLNDKLAEQKQY